VEQFSELGSGFNISMRDLDIRGAGNMLGGEQSGFISEVGFDMYQKILQEAIEELKEEEFKDLFKDELAKDVVKECALETDFELLLPDDYVNNVAERLLLYRELDSLENEQDLEKYVHDLEDRFGRLPEPGQQLLESMRLRWIAKEIGFTKLILKNGKMIGYFLENQDSPYFQTDRFGKVLNFIKFNPPGVKLAEKNNKLRLVWNEMSSVSQAIEEINRLK